MIIVELPDRIKENIQYFTGRTGLIPPILEWLATDKRIFMVTGDPDTGKSMLAAWLGALALSRRPSSPSAAGTHALDCPSLFASPEKLADPTLVLIHTRF